MLMRAEKKAFLGSVISLMEKKNGMFKNSSKKHALHYKRPKQRA
jgi:hypothetical protein